MEIFQSSYVPRWGGGGYSQLSPYYVDLDQASTIYPQKYHRYQAYPQNYSKVSNPQKIFQFCSLILRKKSP